MRTVNSATRVAFLFWLLGHALACRARETNMPERKQNPMTRHWDVYRDKDLVATVVDEPGPITVGICSVDQKGKTHRFLTAKWVDILYKRDFERLLAESKSTREFLQELQAEGFRIKQTLPLTAADAGP